MKEINLTSHRSPENVDQHGECLLLSISCLEKNIGKMFELLSDLTISIFDFEKLLFNFLDPDFKDFKHFKNLLSMYSSDAANSFMEDSLTYALSYAAGGFREAVRKTEKLQSVNFSFLESNCSIKLGKIPL